MLGFVLSDRLINNSYRLKFRITKQLKLYKRAIKGTRIGRMIAEIGAFRHGAVSISFICAAVIKLMIPNSDDNTR